MLTLAPAVAFAQSNPFADAMNRGDVRAAGALFSDDVVAEGGFSRPTCNGKAELLRALRHAVAIHTQITTIGQVQQLPIGNAFQASAEIRDDDSRAAGVSRYISVRTVHMGLDNRASRVEEYLDTSDPETARFAQYLQQSDSRASFQPPYALIGAGVLLVAALVLVGCRAAARAMAN